MSTDDEKPSESAPAPQRATLVVVVDVSADDLGDAQAAAARIAQTMRYRVLDALSGMVSMGAAAVVAECDAGQFLSTVRRGIREGV